jgi:hypothetical protein
MLVNGITDPVDFWITTNSIMVWINADDFEVLVGGILSNPVRVENSESTIATANTFLVERKEILN